MSTATKAKKRAPAKTAVLGPITTTLAALPKIGASFCGGIFAGLARGLNAGDPDVALIDLGISDQDMKWADAEKFAAERGGVRPTREEGRILWANLDKRTGESHGYFWLDEQCAGHAAYAWFQNFYGGTQYGYRKGFELRARAVRRLPIQ